MTKNFLLSGFNVTLLILDGMFDLTVSYKGVVNIRVRSSREAPAPTALYIGKVDIPVSTAKYLILSLGSFSFSLFGIKLGWNLIEAYVIDTSTYAVLSPVAKEGIAAHSVDNFPAC